MPPAVAGDEEDRPLARTFVARNLITGHESLVVGADERVVEEERDALGARSEVPERREPRGQVQLLARAGRERALSSVSRRRGRPSRATSSERSSANSSASYGSAPRLENRPRGPGEPAPEIAVGRPSPPRSGRPARGRGRRGRGARARGAPRPRRAPPRRRGPARPPRRAAAASSRSAASHSPSATSRAACASAAARRAASGAASGRAVSSKPRPESLVWTSDESAAIRSASSPISTWRSPRRAGSSTSRSSFRRAARRRPASTKANASPTARPGGTESRARRSGPSSSSASPRSEPLLLAEPGLLAGEAASSRADVA